jgi:NAD(P)-dependent dehydrogenase (short-subunit alcohol dehydrogenase family)
MTAQFLSSLFSLEGKNAVVIGGGGHLCSEVARGFSKAGARVAVLDLRLEKAITVAKSINEDIENSAISGQIDVSDENSIKQNLDLIIDNFGKIDILVNGAGINSSEPFLEITKSSWNEVFNSQVLGTFLACKIFGQHMLLNKSGSVINFSSASSDPPLSKAFAYSAAKAGIKNLTKNLAREWGTLGIRVNALRPGFFPTEWNRKNFIDKSRELAILSHTPMRRFGEPVELVSGAIWLASDSSSFVTGTELIIDGGFLSMTI